MWKKLSRSQAQKERYANEKKRHARVIAAFRSIFQWQCDSVSARHQQVSTAKVSMSAHHYVAATEFARLQGPASVPMATRILTVPRRYASAVVASMANVISKNGNVAAILARG